MPSVATRWVLIAHGGAKDIAAEHAARNREGMAKAVAAGSAILKAGGSAIDAVEAAIRAMELDPAFNAGLYGSVRNEEGAINMDAAIMDGQTLDIGSVAHVQAIEHPISVAKALLRDRATLLVSEGANRYAQAQGFEGKTVAAEATAVAECDTVGCVALDAHGLLAAGTSTGGLSGVRLGRVGDVPLPGCGFYADNALGAMSASGDGEIIARTVMGLRYLHAAQGTAAPHAARDVLERVAHLRGEAGIIAIHPDGTVCWDHTSPHFAVGVARADREAEIYLQKRDEHA